MHVGIAYLRWRGKRSRHSRRMRTRNFAYLARGPWLLMLRLLASSGAHFTKGFPYAVELLIHLCPNFSFSHGKVHIDWCICRWLGANAIIISCCVVFSAAFLALLERENLEPAMVGFSIMYSLTVSFLLMYLNWVSSDIQYHVYIATTHNLIAA